MPRRLEDLGEHGWIRRLLPRLAEARTDRRVLVAAGDDAAAVRPGRRPLLLTVDALHEGVHFRAGWMAAAALGRRAFAVNASDLAAMGGVPTFALLALEVPPRMPLSELDAVVGGFTAAARRSGARLIGGNVSAGPGLGLTVTLLGEAPGRIVTRGGARAGDVLYLTGTIGRAGLAVRRLRAGRRERLPAPPLRTRAGLLIAPLADAMIDVSDGVVQDLGHVCRASGVAAEIDLGRLPVAPACRRALGAGAAAFAAVAGEDYELLFAMPPNRVPRLSALRRRLGCRVTRIGRVIRGRPEVRVLDEAGRRCRLSTTGFDHFR